jgi:hypothetical protein
MNENDDIISQLDPCPDEPTLKDYARGKLDNSPMRRPIEAHLELCDTCRSKMRDQRMIPEDQEELVEQFARRLRDRRDQYFGRRYKSPTPGTVWRTVSELEDEIYGPMVIVLEGIGKFGEGVVEVAELSEEVHHAINTDVILDRGESGLAFRCMVRAGNIFRMHRDNLKAFAEKIPSELTNKVTGFCKMGESFDEGIALSHYSFATDKKGTRFIRRQGITSGIPPTRHDDPRLAALDLCKRKSDYLKVEEDPRGTIKQDRVTKRGHLIALQEYLFEKAGALAVGAALGIGVREKLAQAEKEFKRLEAKVTELGTANEELRSLTAKLSDSLNQAERRLSLAKQTEMDLREDLRRREMEPFLVEETLSMVPALDMAKGNRFLASVRAGDLRTVGEVVQAERGYLRFRDEEKGFTSLHWAIFELHEHVVAYLLQEGAELDAVDNRGETPLMITARNGNVAIAKLLLGRGADPSIRNDRGRTANVLATESGNEEVARLLESR